MKYYATRKRDNSLGEGYRGDNLLLFTFSTLDNLNKWLNCDSLDGFIPGERKRITLNEAIRIFGVKVVEFNKNYIDNYIRSY